MVSVLDVVALRSTQHPDICWVKQSLQRHLLQRGKPAQRSGSPTYNFFAKLAISIQDQFEYVIWRSLQ
ncbi:hypothetical protein H6G91_09545 [Nostoc muscorum FACHB-395]|nr:hypothetical protein [Desmonostoc muscorum FACHB-395]